MRKTKVFHIISHFDVGGAERVALNIAKSESEGFEYHIVELIRAHSPFTKVFIKELEACGIKYHRGFVPEIHFHYIVERLAAMLFPLWFLPIYLKHRPGVVHSHTEMPDLAVYTFFKLFPWAARRCKVVRTIHNTRLWTGMERTGSSVERFFIRNNASIAISASVQGNYLKEYGFRAPIIYNGVSPTTQKPYPDIVEGRTNVLFAGRFEPQKGISTLIRIIESLKDSDRYHFHIIGDGSLRQEIEDRIGSYSTVSLRPALYGLPAYLVSFDYMIMPSEFEGLSIMSIEASMEGLPVIINDAPGLSDTLPKDWPLKVENNSIEAYARIFNDVLPRANRKEFGDIARVFVTKNFGIKEMQRRYEEVYSNL